MFYMLEIKGSRSLAEGHAHCFSDKARAERYAASLMSQYPGVLATVLEFAR